MQVPIVASKPKRNPPADPESAALIEAAFKRYGSAPAIAHAMWPDRPLRKSDKNAPNVWRSRVVPHKHREQLRSLTQMAHSATTALPDNVPSARAGTLFGEVRFVDHAHEALFFATVAILKRVRPETLREIADYAEYLSRKREVEGERHASGL